MRLIYSMIISALILSSCSSGGSSSEEPKNETREDRSQESVSLEPEVPLPNLDHLCDNSTDTHVFLFAGQSNMQGLGDESLSTVVDASVAQEFIAGTNIWNPPSLLPLKDPVGEWWVGSVPNPLHVSGINLDKTISGSLLPAFAKRFNELNGKKTISIHAARGGAGLHPDSINAGVGNWDPNNSLYKAMVEKTDLALEFTQKPLSGLFWLQGETDGATITGNLITQEQYAESLRNFIRAFVSKYNAPVFLIPPGYLNEGPVGGSDVGIEAVGKAQEQIASESEFEGRVYIVYNELKNLRFAGSPYIQSDHAHFTQEGYNKIGKEVAEQLDLLSNCP